MNDYIVTQTDVDLLMQSTKVLYYKLELLNENMKIIESIEGNLISDNISIDSNSDIRRTYTCEMIVTNSSFNIGKNKFIWFDKMIKPYIGILYQRTKEIVWYCLGTYLFVDTNYNFDSTTNTLSLTCNDMMCLLNDTRNGQLDAYSRIIKAGSDARNVIISLLKEVSITKYVIEFNINNNSVSTFQIPYDMTYNSTTAYTIIKEIVDLYSGTQMYFDIDGTFIISPIPTSHNEISLLDDNVLQKVLISEQITTSLSTVYNKIQVWGKVNEPDFYTKDVNAVDNIYNVSLVYSKLEDGVEAEVEYDEYQNFDILAINVPITNQSNQMIKINNLDEVLIVDDQGNSLQENYLKAGLDYVFRYRKLDNTFLYIGQYQCFGEAYLTNNKNDTNEYAVIDEDNDFAINVIGERLKVLSDGDYSNIYTNSLCNQRAKWELRQSINLGVSLTLEIVAIPWLDVNQIIEFTSNSINETYQYIVTSISCDYSDFKMSLSLSRYYPNLI